jgi:putative methyltransferase (TIGR04325 family)
MTVSGIARRLLPPIVSIPARALLRLLRPDRDSLAYAPDGWRTTMPELSELEWDRLVAKERRAFRCMLSQDLASTPWAGLDAESAVPFADLVAEHNQWVAFAYVLAVAALDRDRVKVLDYGGSLGFGYPVAKSALPGIEIEYHCKELGRLAEAGREVNPAVIWHSDNSCLRDRYDVVMMSFVLQYIPDWKDLLQHAASSCMDCLFITGVPSVLGPGFVSVERREGNATLSQALNRRELLGTVHALGFSVAREFLVDVHPAVSGAPEQPVFAGWLFRRGPHPP